MEQMGKAKIICSREQIEVSKIIISLRQAQDESPL